MDIILNTEHAQFINWIPPFVKVLRDKGGSATPKEIRDGISKVMELSDEFLSERYAKSNLLKFDNQVYWAKQYLAWERLVETSKRGVWALTDEGWNVSMSYDDALKLFQKWVKIHQNARKDKKQKKAEQTITTISGIEEDVTADIDAEDNENLSLLEILKKTTPVGFEHLCGRLLREYDFEDIEITSHTNDGGIDGTATLKINAFVNMSVYFQCKKYENTVPISHIREFLGVLATDQNGVDRGLFITTGTFTKSAYELEKKNTRLELIDGDKLVSMFERVEIGVKPRTVFDPDIAFFSQYIT